MAMLLHSSSPAASPSGAGHSSTPIADAASRGGSGARGALVALGLAALLCAPVLAIGFGIHLADVRQRLARREAAVARLASLDRALAAPAGAVIPVETAKVGRSHFAMTCAACHKIDGTGVPGLGKDLVHSWFLASLTDEEAADFLEVGRPANSVLNTTRVAMPPRGNNPALTRTDLLAIVGYLRGLQDPRRMPELPAQIDVIVAPTTSGEMDRALVLAGGDKELAEYIAHGTKLFAATCAACHGPDARGIKSNGKDLVASEFAKGLDDDGLLAFIQKGRDPGDPANTTGVAMPPKGGNPALSEDDLLDIIDYVRALQREGASK